MPNPILRSTPIHLKTNGRSKFWLHADNVEVDNEVLIVKSDGSAGYWDGTIDQIHGTKGPRANVSFQTGNPPAYQDTGMTSPPWGPGDIITVTITVTNHNNSAEKGSIGDDAVVDAAD